MSNKTMSEGIVSVSLVSARREEQLICMLDQDEILYIHIIGDMSSSWHSMSLCLLIAAIIAAIVFGEHGLTRYKHVLYSPIVVIKLFFYKSVSPKRMMCTNNIT